MGENVFLPKTLLAGQLQVDAAMVQQNLSDVAVGRDGAGFAMAAISSETQECIECHQEQMPGIISQWQSSTH